MFQEIGIEEHEKLSTTWVLGLTCLLGSNMMSQHRQARHSAERPWGG